MKFNLIMKKNVKNKTLYTSDFFAKDWKSLVFFLQIRKRVHKNKYASKV